MQERELRHMISQVKAGTLGRREFVQAMLAPLAVMFPAETLSITGGPVGRLPLVLVRMASQTSSGCNSARQKFAPL